MSANSEKGGREPGLFNRFFIFLWLINLASMLAHSSLNSVIAPFIEYLGFSSAYNGYIGIVFAVFAIASRFLCGSLSDRVGRRLLLVLSALLFMIGALFYGILPASILSLLLFRGFQSFGYGTNAQTVSAATADVMPASKVGFGIGAIWLGMSVSQILSSALVSRAIANKTYFTLFMILAGVLVVAAVLGFLCNYEKKSWFRRAEPEQDSGERGLRRYMEPKAIPAGVILIFACVGFVGITHFFYSYVGSIGYAHPELFFYISAVIMFIQNVIVARFADKAHPLTLLTPGLLGGAVCHVLLSLSAGSPNVLIPIASVFYGLAMGTVNPMLNQIAVKASPDSRRGAASATFFFAMDVGFAIGTVFWGWAVAKMPFSTLYLIAAVFMLLSLAMGCVFLLRRKQP